MADLTLEKTNHTNNGTELIGDVPLPLPGNPSFSNSYVLQVKASGEGRIPAVVDGIRAYGFPGGGVGVRAEGFKGDGVTGTSHDDTSSGVAGVHTGNGHGVYGQCATGDGVQGNCAGAGSGVAGLNSSNGNGVYGRSAHGWAGRFDGNVYVTGKVTSTGGDCAEDFDVAEPGTVEPGMVVVAEQDGKIRPGRQAYDRRTVGVISGAGDLQPGLILGRDGSNRHRMPVALLGRTYCRVDAQYGPIEAGDLLTTSATPGHAMKADEPGRVPGAVLGKALRPFASGIGMIPILVMLR